jgi:predicted Zn-dependent protease
VLAAGAAFTWAFSVENARTSTTGISNLDRAKIAFADRDFDLAEQILQGILSESPGNRISRLLLGRVLLDRHRPARAVEIFTAILKDIATKLTG